MVATSWSCMGIAIYFALVAAGLVAAFVLTTLLRGIKLI
ncbi:cytochrome B6 [Synechococcus sp. RSCCF101]|nr:cytochrome B6 [Synechococcus sp. RSCCF101]